MPMDLNEYNPFSILRDEELWERDVEEGIREDEPAERRGSAPTFEREASSPNEADRPDKRSTRRSRHKAAPLPRK